MAFVIAHRGDAASYLENSLQAFQAAISLGLAYVELDVQLSLDACPIVIHDDNLARTHGIAMGVTTSSYRTLEQAGVFARGFLPEPLLLLSTFSDWMNSTPQVFAFVELKRESIQRHGRKSVLKATASVLLPLRSRVALISYDLGILELAQSMGWETGYIVQHVDDCQYMLSRRLAPLWMLADYRELLGQKRLQRGPWRWASFEVSSLTIAELLIDLGVDGLETMNPKVLLSAGHEATPSVL